MRRWQLTERNPRYLCIAADARIRETDYTDDQIWLLTPGQDDKTAFTLQSRYGGRVGLVSLVPIWTHENGTVFQTVDYESPPVITGCAPGYLRAEAQLLPDVEIIAEYCVTESHAITGCFTVRNTGTAPVTVKMHLYAHVLIRSIERQVTVLTLNEGENALYIGKFAGIDPVVAVERGTAEIADDGKLSARIGTELTLDPDSANQIRWAHAGLPDPQNSVRLARYWMGIPWDDILQQIETTATAIPHIETGNPDWNAAIAFSYQQILQSLLQPTDHLPHTSFVTSRDIQNGYSAAGDGSDYPREWIGQNPTAAYLLVRSLASVAPSVAEGIIKNYIASQQEDGFIDHAPGMGGQRREWLAMPVLAHLSWQIFQITQNAAFIEAVFSPLQKFFNRWFAADTDTDADSAPEWQNIAQTGYAGWSLFNGNVDITTTESPDLIAYLISECDALIEMANHTGDTAAAETLRERHTELVAVLNEMWTGEEFAYRDRDTHATPRGITVLQQGRGDEEHLPAVSLSDASRLVIEVTGGAGSKPRMSIEVHGLDTDGNAQSETIDADAFIWSYGRGTATSQIVYSQVDRIRAQGLSRVYRITARSVDLDEIDLNTVLPLFTSALTDAQATGVVNSLWKNLLRPNGLALFTPGAEPGSKDSGIWVYWNALICEGLLHYGYRAQAVDLLQRLLNVQTATLRNTGYFTPFYDETDRQGRGDRTDVTGAVPVYLLMQAAGIQISPAGSVQIEGDFAWGEPITIQQYGITIARTSTETTVTLPGGTTHTIPAGETRQLEIPVPQTALPTLPEKPALLPQSHGTTPVKIEVEIEDETDA